MRAHYLCGIILSVALSGCSTTADIVGHKDDGTARVYDVSPDQGWELAKLVFRTEGADAIEEHHERGYMLTSSSSNFYSSGTVMGAWVESDGANRMKLTVVSKRRIATDLLKTLTEGTLHRRFAQGVRIINAGHPLPLVLPDSYEVKSAQSGASEARALQAANSEKKISVSQADGWCPSPEQPALVRPILNAGN